MFMKSKCPMVFGFRSNILSLAQRNRSGDGSSRSHGTGGDRCGHERSSGQGMCMLESPLKKLHLQMWFSNADYIHSFIKSHVQGPGDTESLRVGSCQLFAYRLARGPRRKSLVLLGTGARLHSLRRCCLFYL